LAVDAALAPGVVAGAAVRPGRDSARPAVARIIRILLKEFPMPYRESTAEYP
jgi:hypothetical protein